MEHQFRFGYQLSRGDSQGPLAAALEAEAVGFDVVLASDHVGPGSSPLVTLSAVAQVTKRIRLGTLVLNNDMRNPVQLAWEAATLDRLSGGRFELGLGAGHTPQEYTETGVAFDGPKIRKERLMESIEVIRLLLDGETVTYAGMHVQAEDASIDAPHQARLPILVGGNGSRLLAHAGAHADIVGLQGLGRTHSDGHSHDVKFDPAWLDTQINQVRSGAGDRFGELEINVLVQVAQVTNDADEVIAETCDGIDGLTREHASATPYILVGTVDEIAAKIHSCRDRWGISYFVVRQRRGFADVISALR